jgi:hypothetical protein
MTWRAIWRLNAMGENAWRKRVRKRVSLKRAIF